MTLGRFAGLPLVVLVALSGLVAVRFFGPRINASMLAEVRASGGEEVMKMKRSMLVLALCAGCTAADPGGGSMLLPTSDAAPAMRGPVGVPGDDAGTDAVAPPADAVASVDGSPVVAPDVAPVSPDALPFPVCSMPPKSAEHFCVPGPESSTYRKGGYVCAICAGVEQPGGCLAPSPAPRSGCGDLVLCVPSCSECVPNQPACEVRP